MVYIHVAWWCCRFEQDKRRWFGITQKANLLYFSGDTECKETRKKYKSRNNAANKNKTRRKLKRKWMCKQRLLNTKMKRRRRWREKKNNEIRESNNHFEMMKGHTMKWIALAFEQANMMAIRFSQLNISSPSLFFSLL